MSTFNASIAGVVAGDDLDIERTFTAVPAGQLLTKAWLTFKTALADADPGLLQKVITINAGLGVGQITDAGASGTGALLFQLTGANTLALPVLVDVRYGVKVLTSAGKIYTVEQGIYLAVPRVTTATS